MPVGPAYAPLRSLYHYKPADPCYYTLGGRTSRTTHTAVVKCLDSETENYKAPSSAYVAVSLRVRAEFRERAGAGLLLCLRAAVRW